MVGRDGGNTRREHTELWELGNKGEGEGPGGLELDEEGRGRGREG